MGDRKQFFIYVCGVIISVNKELNMKLRMRIMLHGFKNANSAILFLSRKASALLSTNRIHDHPVKAAWKNKERNRKKACHREAQKRYRLARAERETAEQS